jgi:hypothetical protein
MPSIRILQYNMDNLQWGLDYFCNAAKDADVFLLQRVPMEAKKDIESIIDCRLFFLESTPGVGNLCVAMGKKRVGNPFSKMKSITLPSYEKVVKIGGNDKAQGCTALRAQLGGINIITFLPCYSQDNSDINSIHVNDLDRKSDIEFLLNLYKDRPTIIAGDFHTSPHDKTTEFLLHKYDFKSYLDEYNTYIKPNKSPFNLDKLVSNIDVDISDVIVYDKDIDNSMQGHLAISYRLEYNVEED